MTLMYKHTWGFNWTKPSVKRRVALISPGISRAWVQQEAKKWWPHQMPSHANSQQHHDEGLHQVPKAHSTPLSWACDDRWVVNYWYDWFQQPSKLHVVVHSQHLHYCTTGLDWKCHSASTQDEVRDVTLPQTFLHWISIAYHKHHWHQDHVASGNRGHTDMSFCYNHHPHWCIRLKRPVDIQHHEGQNHWNRNHLICQVSCYHPLECSGTMYNGETHCHIHTHPCPEWRFGAKHHNVSQDCKSSTKAQPWIANPMAWIVKIFETRHQSWHVWSHPQADAQDQRFGTQQTAGYSVASVSS